MAEHILGPLYYERMGRKGPAMVFVHPNPMDQSCWIFQMAHLSTWYRCMAIDIPGYGRSPKAEPGLTMEDMAQACWEAVDEAGLDEPAILVGCSVGSNIIRYMYHIRPAYTAAIVLSGTGHSSAAKEFPARRIKNYTEEGIGFRWDHTFQDMSPAFRATPMAHFFARMFTERNDVADVSTIVHQFRALAQTDPDNLNDILCPVIILSGSEDSSHQRAFLLKERIPGCELKVLPGAGHACQLEQPWLYDSFMLEFLAKHDLFPGSPKPAPVLV